MESEIKLDDLDFDEDLDVVTKPKVVRYDTSNVTNERPSSDRLSLSQGPTASTSGLNRAQNGRATSSASQPAFSKTGPRQSGNGSGLNRSGQILVNPKQKGNPLLASIECNRVLFSDIAADYVMSRVSCALFLSLKYHNVYPNYIYERINGLGKQYQLRVLVVLIDIPNANQVLKELMQVCLLSDFVLMCAWTFEEAGKIIDTYKVFENRSPESLMDKPTVDKMNDYQCLLDSLSSIKSINKTDAISLVSTFESLERIIKANPEQLSVVPGLGPSKGKVLYEFYRRKTKR